MDKLPSLFCALVGASFLRMGFQAWSKKASWDNHEMAWRKSKPGSKEYLFDVSVFAGIGLVTIYIAALMWVRSKS